MIAIQSGRLVNSNCAYLNSSIIRRMVPSSARATAPPTTPLPVQLVPLLEDAVTTVKDAISRVVSTGKKRTALEEAEWEEDSEEGALKREMALQGMSCFHTFVEEHIINSRLAMEVLRVYRPRVVLHGAPGMGQRYVAEAALHSLDGFHIHGFDLVHILSDSTRVGLDIYLLEECSSHYALLHRHQRRQLYNFSPKQSATSPRSSIFLPFLVGVLHYLKRRGPPCSHYWMVLHPPILFCYLHT